MAKKIMGATISLKDGGFKSGIKEAVASLEKYKKGSDGASSSAKKFGTQANSTGSNLASMAKKVAGTVAAYAGFNQVKDFVTDCVTGVMELERANTRLETLMMNVKGTTKEQVEGIIEYADALELVTTIEGDATTAGASQLATFQLQSSTIKTLMPAFQDLAVAQYGVNVSQEQMIQTGNLIGKVMNGSVGALTKAGVSFTAQQEKILKTGTEAQKAATLVDVLGANFGGLAQKMAQTDEGKIVQLKNAWGSVKDEVGFAVLPVVSNVVSFLAERIPQIRDTVTNAIDKTKSALTEIKNVGSEVWGAMNEGLQIARDNWNWLGPIIYGVVGAIATYNAIVGVKNILTTIAAATTGLEAKALSGMTIAQLAGAAATGVMTAATTALGAAMAFVTSPIFLVTLAIGALIAIGVLLYKNWDTVCAFAKTAWQGVKDAFVNVWNGIKTAFSAGVEWVKNNIQSIVLFIINPFAGVFNYLYTNFEGFRNFINGMVQSVKNTFVTMGTNIADGVSGAFRTVINSVIRFAGNLINNFINSINFAIDVINKIPGVGISKLQTVNLPMLANGGNITRPGSVIVGERGPEMLHLPRGASVEPLDRKGGKTENKFYINIDARDKSPEEIANELVPKLKLALEVL